MILHIIGMFIVSMQFL